MENTQASCNVKILDILDKYNIKYEPHGQYYICKCIFHNDMHKPNMVIYPETNSFYCFRCNKSGTPETIVMKQERIPYHKAKEKLYGVEVLASSLLTGEVTEVKPNQQYMMDKLAELIFAKKHLITNLPELIKHLIYCNISVREYIKILKQLEQL